MIAGPELHRKPHRGRFRWPQDPECCPQGNAEAPGQSTTLGAYAFTYRGIEQSFKVDERLTEARIDVTRGGKLVSIMRPRNSVFVNFENQPSSHIAIRSTPIEDLYIFMAAFDQNVATFVIFINPMVMWLWIGGIVFLLGTVVTAWPQPEPAWASVARPARGAVPSGP